MEWEVNLVKATDDEIAKSNRLFQLKKLHRSWSGKKSKNQTEENIMAKEKLPEVCEQCGKTGVATKVYYGKKCCSSCGAVRGAVKNRPQVVSDVYTEMHGALLVGEPESAEVDYTVLGDKLWDWEAFYEQAISKYSPQHQGIVEDHQERIAVLLTVFEDCFTELSQKKKILAELRQCMSIDPRIPDERIKTVLYSLMTQPASPDTADEIGEVTPASDYGWGLRNDQLLDIALAALRGEYTIVADQIELLRRR